MSATDPAILIAGTVDVDPAQREAALEAARPLMAQTRDLPGCQHYVWSADPATPGRIYVYEAWESEATLAAHFAGALYHAMRAAIGAHGLRAADVQKFRIARAEPVYDPDGRPRADFFTAPG